MKHNLDHIIARILAGEASPDEFIQFSDWLHQRDDHQQLFKQLKGYWDAEVSYTHTIEPQLSFQKLSKEMNRRMRMAGIRRFIRLTLPAAAAIAALVAISVFFIDQYIANQKIEYFTYLTDDGKSRFYMDDGTRITLNDNSSLQYNDAFGKKERAVELVGEAYFNVASDPGKPFVVTVGDAEIVVLGTQFNVKEVKENNQIITTLVEGSIDFKSGSKSAKMKPGQQLIFDQVSRRFTIQQVDPDLYTAWINGLLKYKSIPFTRLISDLEQSFGVEIRVENRHLLRSDVTVTGTFSKEQNIEQILKVIARSVPIKWHNGNGIYYIQYDNN